MTLLAKTPRGECWHIIEDGFQDRHVLCYRNLDFAAVEVARVTWGKARTRVRRVCSDCLRRRREDNAAIERMVKGGD